MLDSDETSVGPPPQESVSPQRPPSLGGTDAIPYDSPVRLVGHRVREVRHGVVQVEVQITCKGRTFSGSASGFEAARDRLGISALATLRALDACIRIFSSGTSAPTLVLDAVIEVSVGDCPVAVVMISASEYSQMTPLVAACPLVGMSDHSLILATLQATTRTVSRWVTRGDRSPGAEAQERPQ